MHLSRFHPGVRFLKLKPCTWLVLNRVHVVVALGRVETGKNGCRAVFGREHLLAPAKKQRNMLCVCTAIFFCAFPPFLLQV